MLLMPGLLSNQPCVMFLAPAVPRIEIAQSFMHRFSDQVWLRNFIRKSRATQTAFIKRLGSAGKLLEKLHYLSIQINSKFLHATC